MADRIHSIDAVRAMALLGILLVHSHDVYNAPAAAPPGALDALCDWAYEWLFISKAFMAFSFLFGLSFFLQMDHATARGIDFRARFCWRLALLFGFGLLHTAFYGGDILLVFALLGLLPVLLWKARSGVILALAAILLAHPTDCWAAATGQPGAVFDACARWANAWGLAPSPDLLSASWADVAVWNLTDGLGHRALYMLYSGRLWSVMAMFLLGMIAGRARLFEPAQTGKLPRVALAALLAFALCRVACELAPDAWRGLLAWWGNEAYVLFILPGLAWLFSHEGLLQRLRPLTAIGRCTLSCYIGQSVILCGLYYGWGLGAAPRMSVTARVLAALVLFVLQLGACAWWLRSHRYGPLEGVWRKLTRIGMASPSPASAAQVSRG